MASNNMQGGGKAAAPDRDEELDPKFEWFDNANNFLLRLTLTGFKKEDFRVQVDGTGKLTVRGQLPAADGNKHFRFQKIFQLPSNANIDNITGRFEANVLTITIPKHPAPPATVQEIKQHANKPTAKQDADDEAKKKKMEEEEAAKKKKLLEEEARKKELEEEAMAKRGKQDQHKPATERKEQQVRAEPAAAPGLVVDRESLAEKAKRRAEEERAKAATAFSGWRERVAGELEHLADMRWAEGVVETARRNKDVIATAVAAFSIGFFVSQKLFCRR